MLSSHFVMLRLWHQLNDMLYCMSNWHLCHRDVVTKSFCHSLKWNHCTESKKIIKYPIFKLQKSLIFSYKNDLVFQILYFLAMSLSHGYKKGWTWTYNVFELFWGLIWTFGLKNETSCKTIYQLSSHIDRIHSSNHFYFRKLT